MKNMETCPVLNYLNVPTFSSLYLSLVYLLYYEKVLITWRLINTLPIYFNIWTYTSFISETKCFSVLDQKDYRPYPFLLLIRTVSLIQLCFLQFVFLSFFSWDHLVLTMDKDL